MLATGSDGETIAMRFIFAGCCARAISGDAAALPMSVINSRRFMPTPLKNGLSQFSCKLDIRKTLGPVS